MNKLDQLLTDVATIKAEVADIKVNSVQTEFKIAEFCRIVGYNAKTVRAIWKAGYLTNWSLDGHARFSIVQWRKLIADPNKRQVVADLLKTK